MRASIPWKALNYYYLSEVVRPDGLRWRYRYYPFNSAQDAAGDYSMQSVTYPYGASITYTYKKVDFDPSNVDGQWDDPTTVVATKTVSGGPTDGSSVGPGSSTSGRRLDLRLRAEIPGVISCQRRHLGFGSR